MDYKHAEIFEIHTHASFFPEQKSNGVKSLYHAINQPFTKIALAIVGPTQKQVIEYLTEVWTVFAVAWSCGGLMPRQRFLF